MVAVGYRIDKRIDRLSGHYTNFSDWEVLPIVEEVKDSNGDTMYTQLYTLDSDGYVVIEVSGTVSGIVESTCRKRLDEILDCGPKAWKERSKKPELGFWKKFIKNFV